MSHMDTMPNDMFAAMYTDSDNIIISGSSPFEHHNVLVHPFDLSVLTPSSSSQLSGSAMDLSGVDQDPFHAPSPSQLTHAPLDMSACDNDLFNRQLFSTILTTPVDHPFSSIHPLASAPAPATTDTSLTDSLLRKTTDLSLSSLSQDMEMADASLETKQEPTESAAAAAAVVAVLMKKEKTTTSEKKTAVKPPGTTKRHSVSRQAQQPP
ncbi:hypothetical protein BGZ98_004836, partial [Dissophora globulifera]